MDQTDEIKNKAKKAKKEFDQNMEQALQEETESFDSMITTAVGDAKETEKNLKELVSGIALGSGKAELRKIPLRDKLTLAET